MVDLRTNWMPGERGHDVAHNESNKRINTLAGGYIFVETADGDVLQQRVDEAVVGGKTVVLPFGTIAISRTLYLRNVSMVGRGAGKSILHFTGSGPALVVGDPNQATVLGGARLADFTVGGAGSVESDGIRISHASNAQFDRVNSHQFTRAAWDINGMAWVHTLRNCSGVNSGIGLAVASGGSAVNLTAFYGGRFSGTRGIVLGRREAGDLSMWRLGNISFYDVDIEGSTCEGLWIAEGMSINARGCRFESNNEGVEGGAHVVIDSGATAVTFDGCYFTDDYTHTAINARGGNTLSARGCSFVHGLQYEDSIGIRHAVPFVSDGNFFNRSVAQSSVEVAVA